MGSSQAVVLYRLTCRLEEADTASLFLKHEEWDSCSTCIESLHESVPAASFNITGSIPSCWRLALFRSFRVATAPCVFRRFDRFHEDKRDLQRFLIVSSRMCATRVKVEWFDHDDGPFDFARSLEMLAMTKLRGLCGVLMLLVVLFSGSVAEAGLFRRCHHCCKTYTTYVTVKKPCVKWVKKYDCCHRPYWVRCVHYICVKVPVTKCVRAC
jgi:hypothetical protein